MSTYSNTNDLGLKPEVFDVDSDVAENYPNGVDRHDHVPTNADELGLGLKDTDFDYEMNEAEETEGAEEKLKVTQVSSLLNKSKDDSSNIRSTDNKLTSHREVIEIDSDDSDTDQEVDTPGRNDTIICCECNTGCNTTRCFCKKHGAACDDGCTCTNCANHFNGLDDFFGKSGVRASPCFINWLKGQAADRGQKQISFDDEELHKTLQCELFDLDVVPAEYIRWGAEPTCYAFKDPEDRDPKLVKWAEEWMTLGDGDLREDLRKAKALMGQLYRFGFGIDKEHTTGYFFSFCFHTWVKREEVWHCQECEKEECRDESEWHCRNCCRCTSAHDASETCPACELGRRE